MRLAFVRISFITTYRNSYTVSTSIITSQMTYYDVEYDGVGIRKKSIVKADIFKQHIQVLWHYVVKDAAGMSVVRPSDRTADVGRLCHCTIDERKK